MFKRDRSLHLSCRRPMPMSIRWVAKRASDKGMLMLHISCELSPFFFPFASHRESCCKTLACDVRPSTTAKIRYIPHNPSLCSGAITVYRCILTPALLMLQRQYNLQYMQLVHGLANLHGCLQPCLHTVACDLFSILNPERPGQPDELSPRASMSCILGWAAKHNAACTVLSLVHAFGLRSSG